MNNKEEQNYLDLMSDIITNGHESGDRTGIGTFSKFGVQLRFSLENNTIPVMTTKRIFVRAIIEELLFFLRGETNSKILESKGVNIWKGNTSREFLDKKGLSNYPEGEMGPMYGYMWRNFNGIDQIGNAINLIKNDPNSRRIVVTAYDPSKAHLTVLDPCHPFFQFNVDGDELLCQFVMRSNDLFLGGPFNILSYALLTHIIAKTCGLKAKELIYVCGNAHVYKNHVDPVTRQLERREKTFEFPKLNIKKELTTISDIEKLVFEDFEVIGYQSHPSIKAEMAV
jgi:thymidylate synthase